MEALDELVDIKKVICQNVKKYRKEKQIRIVDFAEQLDVSVEYLKRIEALNDKNHISIQLLYRISNTLEVGIEKFFK